MSGSTIQNVKQAGAVLGSTLKSRLALKSKCGVMKLELTGMLLLLLLPIAHSIVTFHSCRHTLCPRNLRDICPTGHSRKIRLFSLVHDPYSRESNCYSRCIRLNTTTVMASVFIPRLFKSLMSTSI